MKIKLLFSKKKKIKEKKKITKENFKTLRNSSLPIHAILNIKVN